MPNKKAHTTKGIKPPKKHFTKTHAKVYWPYLPLIAILFGSLWLNILQPLQRNQPATLAYATEMSANGLLNATNTNRADAGAGPLVLNSKLAAAAQAKANDMVTRDYWSHITPDGNPPWVFIDAQGYTYAKAGENLAYGFTNSSATVIGWMNSPSHKANMLDTVFKDVGFGWANSANFVGTGNQTVVVAMYGATNLTPNVITPPAPEPAPLPTVQDSTVSNPPTPTPTQESVPQEPEADPIPEIAPEPEQDPDFTPVSDEQFNQPVNTENPIPSDQESQRITRAQQLTGGSAPWSAVAISAVAIGLAVFWLFKHFIIVRKFVIEGEHFVAHHPILDLIVVTILAIAVYLSQSSGVVL